MASGDCQLEEVESYKCQGGFQKVYAHYSTELKCKMKFAVYLPPQASQDQRCPVIYWLSGLTCTEQNFITKSGFHKAAADEGVIVIAPDTSPRDCGIEGEKDSWDFGSGAGFYVDATTEKWHTNYRMYSYVTKELPAIVAQNFPASGKQSVLGHSMGGHGALVCALKNPGLYASVSAFAPICNPSQCPWGVKAFTGYLGENRQQWEAYDACNLVKTWSGKALEILVDQGTADKFLAAGQLLPENLVAASAGVNVTVKLRMQEGYDHSYYFMSSFIQDHIQYHAKFLKA